MREGDRDRDRDRERQIRKKIENANPKIMKMFLRRTITISQNIFFGYRHDDLLYTFIKGKNSNRKFLYGAYFSIDSVVM